MFGRGGVCQIPKFRDPPPCGCAPMISVVQDWVDLMVWHRLTMGQGTKFLTPTWPMKGEAAWRDTVGTTQGVRIGLLDYICYCKNFDIHHYVFQLIKIPASQASWKIHILTSQNKNLWIMFWELLCHFFVRRLKDWVSGTALSSYY